MVKPVSAARAAAAMLCCLPLLLTACGGGEGVPAPPEPLTFGGGIGVREDAAFLTVADRSVPAWEYLYWLARACDRLGAEYREQGQETDWSVQVDSGTLADYAKDQALADTALYATVETLAEKNGCALNAADYAALEAQWNSRCESHGGEDAYLSVLSRYGLDRARAEELFGVGRLYGKLYAQCREGGAFSPTAAELDALVKESGLVQVNRILVASGSDRDAARNRAAVLFSKLNGAEDQQGLFAAMAADTDDPKGPRPLGDGSLDAKLTEIAGSMAEGQISGVVETGEGFSILTRLPIDREALTETWLDAALVKAAQGAEIKLTEACENLDVAAFADGLQTYRDGQAA